MEIDDIAGFPSRVIGREAAVIGGMPVPGGHDEVEMRLETIDERDDRIAVGNG